MQSCSRRFALVLRRLLFHPASIFEQFLPQAHGALWHVSWSVCGTILSVSGEDNKVCSNICTGSNSTCCKSTFQIVLWKENLQGQWQKIDDSDGKR